MYSRDDLKAKFAIIDSTINTGIFRPKGHDSIWLFVTADKSLDQTQYRDRLAGDRLEWESQRSGVKDKQIIEHRQSGLELLVFYREAKKQYPRSGFRYIGPFTYVSHTDDVPRRFVFSRVHEAS